MLTGWRKGRRLYCSFSVQLAGDWLEVSVLLRRRSRTELTAQSNGSHCLKNDFYFAVNQAWLVRPLSPCNVSIFPGIRVSTVPVSEDGKVVVCFLRECCCRLKSWQYSK